MFTQEEKNLNEQTINEPTLNHKFKLALWKRALLFLVGAIGLHIFAFFVLLMLGGVPKENQTALANFIAYALLLVSLFAIVFLDLPKLLDSFKSWKNWAAGIVGGALLLCISNGYFNIVNLFYQFHVNENQANIQSVTVLYPFWSILIFGFVGPICEELTYRTGLFGLIKKYNKVLAIIISSFIFGLAHFNISGNIIDEIVSLPDYIISGVLLVLIYDKFGFAASSITHIINNVVSISSIILYANQ